MSSADFGLDVLGDIVGHSWCGIMFTVLMLSTDSECFSQSGAFIVPQICFSWKRHLTVVSPTPI